MLIIFLIKFLKGLADTEKKEARLTCESVEFESEEEYREKLETLKESLLLQENQLPTAKSSPTTPLSEGVDSNTKLL